MTLKALRLNILPDTNRGGNADSKHVLAETSSIFFCGILKRFHEVEVIELENEVQLMGISEICEDPIEDEGVDWGYGEGDY